MKERAESARFPYLPVRALVRGSLYEAEALLDTGFDGALSLPVNVIASDPRPDHIVHGGLADGTQIEVPLYRGTVWLGHLGPIPVMIAAIGDEALIGRVISDRFTIILDHGRRVIVEP